jgi:hypothetical protein
MRRLAEGQAVPGWREAKSGLREPTSYRDFENVAAAVLRPGDALFAMYYNFVRIHKTLRVAPAIAAGVTNRLWDVSDIVKVLEDGESANEGWLQFDVYRFRVAARHAIEEALFGPGL